MNRIDQVREEADAYLGRTILDAEWAEAYPRACDKLDRIIAREGDANGKRLEPYYLGKLVQEAVTEKAIEDFSLERYRLLMELQREAGQTQYKTGSRPQSGTATHTHNHIILPKHARVNHIFSAPRNWRMRQPIAARREISG